MNTSETNVSSAPNLLEHLILAMASPAITSIQSLNFLVGLPLNLLVIFLLTRAGRLDGSVVLTLSQAVSEILLALVAPLFVLCHVDVKKLCFEEPIAFFFTFSISSGFMFQYSLSWERYLAVVHPVVFMKYKPVKYRLVFSVAIWTTSLAGSVLALLNYSAIPFQVYALLYLLILSSMLFCCISILRGLRKPRPGVRDKEDGGVSAAKKKAFITVSVNLLTFVMETVPTAVTYGVQNLLSVPSFATAFTINLILLIAVGLLKPLFFLYQHGRLRCAGWV